VLSLEVTLGTIVGWFVGLLQAGASQDRDKVLRYRSVARALRTEVQRIMTEMGDREGGPFFTMIYGHTAKVPQVEEWLRTLMTEAAGADPGVLALFLDLSRELHNFQVFETTLAGHREKVQEDRERVREARQEQRRLERGTELPELEPSDEVELPTEGEETDWSAVDLEAMQRGFDHALALMEIESAARLLGDRIEDLEFMQDGGRARIWAKLDALMVHLSPLADLDIPSLWLFTLSRIPPFLPDYPPPDWVLYARGVVPSGIAPAEELVYRRSAELVKARRDERLSRMARRGR
jgi:hypothetical protein